MGAPRILIVRLSAIGDVVHALPALAALRRALPDAHLTWIVESLSKPLLEGHPMLDELIVYPRKQWQKHGYWKSLPGDVRRFFAQMRSRRFEVAIDFQGLTKSAIIPWLSAIPQRIGFGDEDGREISRWFYTDRCKPPKDFVHVIHRNLYLLKPLGIETQAVEFSFPDFSEERDRIDEKLKKIGISPNEPIVLFNPGAGWESKRWPLEYYGKLASSVAGELAHTVLITWGPGEELLVEGTLEAVTPNAKRHVHKAPPTSLREFVALLDRSRLMVGGETGPVHLATARQVPVVCICGGSDPNRNRPLGDSPVRVLTSPECDCVPCWKVNCDNPPPRCMTTITPETVFEKVRESLQSSK